MPPICGGPIDLRAQRVRTEAPVHASYRGVEVYACGPWSQGPLVPMTLNLLRWAIALVVLLPLAGSIFRRGSGLWACKRRFAVLLGSPEGYF